LFISASLKIKGPASQGSKDPELLPMSTPAKRLEQPLLALLGHLASIEKNITVSYRYTY
jgi:hypothetical protein